MSAEHADIPGIPEIHDEAGESSPWLPIFGVAFLLLIAFMVAYHSHNDGDDVPPTNVAATDQQTQ